MKRRKFLAASVLLPLFASSDAFAAKKKPAAKPAVKKSAVKPKAKPGAPAASAETGSSSQETRSVVSLPDEPPAQWRTYDITSTISLSAIDGQTRVWIPLAQYKDSPWQRSLGHRWQGNFDSAGIYRDPVADMEVFYADWDWDENSSQPQLHLISQVAIQDRHFDITRRSNVGERTEVLRRCLQSTEQLPIDGLVRRTAERAIGRIKDPLAQGKAIYDWVVENSEFDDQLAGVGNGEVNKLLESGTPRGKSADIALLFVALCRSIGIPARPVFGLRIDSSRLFGSLGSSGEHQQAQHCRAEFYIPGYGWIPVDPADVRKAIRSENLGLADSRLTVLKKLLFGFWEMNWIGFNSAQDIDLRGARLGKSLPFLVLPQAETGSKHFSSLDATQMSTQMNYRIKASRVDL